MYEDAINGYHCFFRFNLAKESKQQKKEIQDVEYLVGGLELFLFSHILPIIIPIDQLIFFRGIGIPPTRYCWVVSSFFSMQDIMKSLERAIEFGSPVLLENVGEAPWATRRRFCRWKTWTVIRYWLIWLVFVGIPLLEYYNPQYIGSYNPL